MSKFSLEKSKLFRGVNNKMKPLRLKKSFEENNLMWINNLMYSDELIRDW